MLVSLSYWQQYKKRIRLFSNLTAMPGSNKAAMTKTTIDYKAGNINDCYKGN